MKKIYNKIVNWQSWPFKVLYAPISVCWLWYIIKSRKVWFFTSSNPKLTFGGMEGEPKKEMYHLLPEELYPTTFNAKPGECFDCLKDKLSSLSINYPLIVKPEIGGQGILLRKIDHEEDWSNYHSKVPVEYIVQPMIEYPIEVSVFYIRKPNEQKGTITGFLHKIRLHVVGDGKHTLEQLVHQHSKASARVKELYTKHQRQWNNIIPENEVYILNFAANHNRGAKFIDLKKYIDDDLVNVFDKISHDINDFFYGRYDIMCNSIEELKQGKNFTILEYNGCGAEPNHFYDTGYTLLQSYKEILKHWKALYQISKYNSQQGIKPWSFQKGRRFLKDTRKLYSLMKEADKNI